MSIIGDSLSSSLPILCCLSITPLFSQRLRALLLSKKGGAALWSHFRGNVLSLSLFSEMLLWRIFFWNVLYLFLISSMTLGFSSWTIAIIFSSRTVCQAFAQWLMRPTSLNKNRVTSGESIGFLNLGQYFQMQNTAQLQPPAFIDKQQDDLLCQKEAEKIPFLVECWVWN